MYIDDIIHCQTARAQCVDDGDDDDDNNNNNMLFNSISSDVPLRTSGVEVQVYNVVAVTAGGNGLQTQGVCIRVYCSYITGEDENDDDDDRKFKFHQLHDGGREWGHHYRWGRGIPGVEHADRITHRWVFNCDGDNAGRSKELLFSLVAASAA